MGAFFTPESLGRRLSIGPTGDGLWIVRDTEGLCGAVFATREEALRFAKSECAAAPAWASEWRFVPSLEFTALFPPRMGTAEDREGGIVGAEPAPRLSHDPPSAT